MMQKASVLAMCMLLLAAFPSPAADKEDGAGRGWALDGKVGTLGIGADLSRSVVPRVLNLRVGASFYSYSTDFDEEGIHYSAKLKLGAVPVVADVFPFKNWFRFGAGVVINLNEVEGKTLSSTGTVTIGDQTYAMQDIGQVDLRVKVNRASPYFGLGFNNPIKRSGHWGFFADLGVLYHGTPKATLTTTRTVPGLQAEIDREVQDINEDIRDFRIYPVIQIGLSYKF